MIFVSKFLEEKKLFLFFVIDTIVVAKYSTPHRSFRSSLSLNARLPQTVYCRVAIHIGSTPARELYL